VELPAAARRRAGPARMSRESEQFWQLPAER
jgi:hypothetical protein